MVSELTTDQLNEIPSGFNNNIIWNLAHLVAAQQGVCYVRNGLPLIVDEKIFLNYKPDTKPQGYVSDGEVQEIKNLLLSTIDQLEKDYNADRFRDFKSWTNRYGVAHNTIEDSINFLLFHDGLHFGYVMALKHVIRNNSPF
jgi:hypothetical protein